MWEGGQDQLPERTMHAQDEDATQPAEAQEDANEDDGFGDDFDEEFQEGGNDDDFGDFDEADEAAQEPQLTRQSPPQAQVPSILSALVSSMRTTSATHISV